MKYAVITVGGKQYRVSEGDIIEVDKLSQKDGKIIFDQVLLLHIDGNVKLGKPTIAGEKVEAKILGNVKTAKIRVAKFKSKIRYRRVKGFKAQGSTVQIEKIGKTKDVNKKATTRKTAKDKS